MEYEANLRLRAAATLAGRGWPFASRIGQSGMQSLLLNDVPRAAEAAAYLQQMAVGASMLVMQLTLTFILSPLLTLVAILFLASGSIRLAPFHPPAGPAAALRSPARWKKAPDRAFACTRV